MNVSVGDAILAAIAGILGYALVHGWGQLTLDGGGFWGS